MKIGIVGNGCPLILIGGNKDTNESDLLALAESKGISREQIEVVPEEDFAERSKELTKTMAFVMPPRPIEPNGINWSCNKKIPKIGVGRDDSYYSNNTAKRRNKK